MYIWNMMGWFRFRNSQDENRLNLGGDNTEAGASSSWEAFMSMESKCGGQQ